MGISVIHGALRCGHGIFAPLLETNFRIEIEFASHVAKQK